VKKVDDAIFTAEDGQERIINIISILQPFVSDIKNKKGLSLQPTGHVS